MIRYFFLALSLVSCAGVAAFSIADLVGDTKYFDARKELALNWDQDPTSAGPLLRNAISWVPDHPTYWHWLGVTDRFRYVRSTQRVDGDMAIAALEHSLELRPDWPPTLAELLLVRYQLGQPWETQAELFHHIAAVGPYNPEANERLTFVGLGYLAKSAPLAPEDLAKIILRGIHGGNVASAYRVFKTVSSSADVPISVVRYVYANFSKLPWQDRVALNVRVADWLWPRLEASEQEHILGILDTRLETLRVQVIALRQIQNAELRLAFCTRSTREGERPSRCDKS